MLLAGYQAPTETLLILLLLVCTSQLAMYDHAFWLYTADTYRHTHKAHTKRTQSAHKKTRTGWRHAHVCSERRTAREGEAEVQEPSAAQAHAALQPQEPGVVRHKDLQDDGELGERVLSIYQFSVNSYVLCAAVRIRSCHEGVFSKLHRGTPCCDYSAAPE